MIVRLLKTHPLTTILANQQKRNVLVTKPEKYQADDGSTTACVNNFQLIATVKRAVTQAILLAASAPFVLALPYTDIYIGHRVFAKERSINIAFAF